MKKYRVCIESYLSNNSDLKEYNIYYIVANNEVEAKEYATKTTNSWNKNSEGVIYHLYDITLYEEGVI